MGTTTQITKEDLLWDRLSYLKVFNSHQVREVGFAMYYDRADRTVRRWAEIGRLQRIPQEECILTGLNKPGNAPLAWWRIC